MANKDLEILYVLNRFPYPTTDGTRERILNELVQLSQDFKLNVLLSTDEYVTEAQKDYLRERLSGDLTIFYTRKFVCIIRALGAILSGKPLQSRYFFNFRVLKWLKHNAKNYHVIYFHTIRNGQYIEHLKNTSACDNTRLLLAFNDAISLNYARAVEQVKGLWRFVYEIEKNRVKQYELILLGVADGFSIVSTIDKNVIVKNWHMEHKQSPPSITVIPNGINADYFRYTYIGKELGLVYFGNLVYPPNREGLQSFLDGIWPAVLARSHQTRLKVVGKGGEWAEKYPNVDVLGFLEKPFDSMCQQALLVCPTNFGAGVPTKVLVGMALGMPIVAYKGSVDSVEGLVDRENIILVDPKQPEVTVQTILELLKDFNFRQVLGSNGRKLMAQKYAWGVTYPMLVNFLSTESARRAK